jgi:5-methyltetrahydrofolate--homocysteine methyltransferase
MKQIFPIVKKYGAAVIGLTLDDNGIPETAMERLAVARKIVERAKQYGIPEEDILIDCLVLTASAQQSMVKETIKAVALVKKELGVKTVLGVSNVSFGLPARHLLNRTFLAGALAAGLDAAIIDPFSEDMQQTVAAFRVLNDEDKEAKDYIQAWTNEKNTPVEESSLEVLIRDGRKHEVEEKVAVLLETFPAQEIINQYLIPALDKIGKGYEKGEYFLPHLIRAAETVKSGLSILKQHSHQEMKDLSRGTIVLATVKGDIHDIGKNIAKMLLENYGFEVIDLGKDVDIDIIVSTVKSQDIKLVGLSALMTTTVKNMALTIQALRIEAPDCKIMVGGAVLNHEYAKMIGADYYAIDSQAGVQIALECFDEQK